MNTFAKCLSVGFSTVACVCGKSCTRISLYQMWARHVKCLLFGRRDHAEKLLLHQRLIVLKTTCLGLYFQTWIITYAGSQLLFINSLLSGS